MQPHNFFSTDATPSHSSRKNLILNSKKSPASTQEVSESENRPATRGTAHSEVQGDERGNVRPMAALHFLPPTGHSPSGSSFDSKLISLPPLDEAPVHVPLRRPRPLRFERLRVPVWNPYSRGRLGPAKSEDRKGGEGKADANLTNFLSTDAAGGTPTRRHALGRLPTPPPLPENRLLRMHRILPTVPPASTQEVSESENRPATRGTAHSEVQGDDRGTA